jgi:hypothetical protein
MVKPDDKSADTSALKHDGVKIVKGKMDEPGSYTPYLEGKDGAFVNADCECDGLWTFDARHAGHCEWLPVRSEW